MKKSPQSLVLLAATAVAASSVEDCPGYKASNVVKTASGLTADLKLAGDPCDAFGQDIPDLKLLVEHQTDSRLHVIIYDADEQVYQVPESYIPRPDPSEHPSNDSQLAFSLHNDPFSFQVARRDSGDVLFNTSSAQLIFESQYVRLRTSLPADANIYGFGEHSDPYRLPTTDYRRTLWNTDAAWIPRNQNLYGSHPVYLEHRERGGSHGVFLLNSNGMDINFNETDSGESFLEYNTIGGVLDYYFFAGPTPSAVSSQYAEVIGLPAMMPYWSLGFQQAKYGYWDVNMLAEVAANYTAADIPLEVIWADIDYMDRRKNFITDPERFPMDKMRELVHTLHERDQHLIMMLDPGMSTNTSYEPYLRGLEAGAYLKNDDGSPFRGVQWAGEVVWPDYNSPEGKEWWIEEMSIFFDPETGLDVDGVWNDMNEVAQFCPDIQCDPKQHADDTNTPPDPEHPPRPNTGRPIPGFPESFQPDNGRTRNRNSNSNSKKNSRSLEYRQQEDAPRGDKKGLPGRDFFDPLYKISNHVGNISDHTVYTNVTNHDGTRQYDTHNMYGLAMVKATRAGLLARRPNKRPFVLTRATFAGSGAHTAHWFGDNESSWEHYRASITQMLGFTSIHQMPMVGTDVCGFNGEPQELMCARWAALASFMPFMRNHADISAPVQEFYQWEIVTESARKSLAARYRLLDYMYTAMYRASTEGVPSVNPLFFLYPSDPATFGIDMQFFFGDAVLVSPVVEDDAQSVEFYLPDDVFYDFWTLEAVRGRGETVTRDNVDWTDIPVHIRGGTIVPLRSESANTTTALREKSFTLVVAPGLDGKASGSLFLDDGETIGGDSSDISLSWDGNELRAGGEFGYESGRVVEAVVVLSADGKETIEGEWSLDAEFTVKPPS